MAILGDRDRKPVARVRRGVDATITALRAGGRLEPVDLAVIAMARTLADQIDAEVLVHEPSRFTIGTLIRTLHPIVTDLRGPDVTDGLDPFIAGLSAPVGDSPLP
jgi:hypothetical protein